MDLLVSKWEEVLEAVKREHDLTNVSFNTWLSPLKVFSVDDQTVTILVPSEGAGSDYISYISKKYTLPIKVAIAEVAGLDRQVTFVLPEDVQSENEIPRNSASSRINAAIEEAHLNPKYTFDTFVVGSNNQFAHAAALAVAESPGEIYNPLFLYAGVGLGKTHLMHSIAHFIIENNPRKKVLYVTSEEFTIELIDAIRNSNNIAMSKFREKYRSIDVLLIDDIQFIVGKESTQEEFFHTFNALHTAKKQIILSSDRPPKDMEILEDRIRSRFEWGLIADISLPDYETRVAILRKKQEADGYDVSDEVIDYIAQNIKSNIRELEGCLNKIRAKGILDKREITIELVQEVLRDIIAPNAKYSVTPDKIISVVAEHFGISVADLKSKKRTSKIVYPRQIAMYLCREMTDLSLVAIAKFLGKKDHSTIISGIDKVETELEVSTTLQDTVIVLTKKINPGP